MKKLIALLIACTSFSLFAQTTTPVTHLGVYVGGGPGMVSHDTGDPNNPIDWRPAAVSTIDIRWAPHPKDAQPLSVGLSFGMAIIEDGTTKPVAGIGFGNGKLGVQFLAVGSNLKQPPVGVVFNFGLGTLKAPGQPVAP